jgi:hypothetical protein
MDHKKDTTGYLDLQKGIDLLISKFGISKTVRIVKQLSGNATFKKNEKQKVQLLVTFIISESQRLFDSEEPQAEEESPRGFNDARMTAYHLIKKYTDMSYQQLGKPFGQSKRAVIYHYNKCEELLSIPQFHKDFTEIYKTLEENIIQFIAKID